ncbi:uncharacterized protein LOC118984333 [Sturnira hondurensis]|uniref:uncharacterized protein LOC118984333 n=1 Tax=Sturnira hondurensis TaxID=192404 RepID=UPI0018791E23|nr:uncharacterized protein LOC118984333 [Sturnira hondurensis]XP_036898089.1 uncharacterized protein LOC118984333 [Sturnira hondurensis]
MRGSAGSGIGGIAGSKGFQPSAPLRAFRLNFMVSFRERTAAGEFRKADSPDPGRGPPQLVLRHARPGCAWARPTRKKPGPERMGENKEPLEDGAVISLSVRLGSCVPFLSSAFPSFLLAFLRRKASLSVFTADLDLNVHTIKARGECQEWGWLSTVGPRGSAKEGATEPRRPPQSSALRLGAGGVAGSRRGGSPWRGEVCGL